MEEKPDQKIEKNENSHNPGKFRQISFNNEKEFRLKPRKPNQLYLHR